MSDNNDIFTGTVDELLDHVTNNQDQLVEDAKASQEELQDLFDELLEEMVEDGSLKKEVINGKAFYSNNEEE
jgi:polyhydroxyalkanoate synthesis regulator phasin|tara:strand:+ start:244 stop:459 length:216 start_codon:yes stop_codon:yes gene_type:complete